MIIQYVSKGLSIFAAIIIFMKIKEIITALEKWAPLHYQEDYDNCGLITGNQDNEITGISICLDVSNEVIEDAISSNHNLIISHHPLIFKGIKKLTGQNYVEKLLIKAIKNDIALYSMHTNLDNLAEGVNKKICDKLELHELKILKPITDKLYKIVVFCPDIQLADGNHVPEMVRSAMFNAGAGQIGNYDSCSFNLEGTGTFRGNEHTNPFIGEKGTTEFQKEIRIETIVPEHLLKQVISAMLEAHPYEEVAYDIYSLKNNFERVGAGMYGYLSNPVTETEFLHFVKETFELKYLKHSKLLHKKIEKVAVCGGSGSFLINQAIKSESDVFITADIKYHDYFLAEDNILLIDIGHFESEQFTTEIIYDFLKEKISTFASLKIKQNFNPINYF